MKLIDFATKFIYISCSSLNLPYGTKRVRFGPVLCNFNEELTKKKQPRTCKSDLTTAKPQPWLSKQLPWFVLLGP